MTEFQAEVPDHLSILTSDRAATIWNKYIALENAHLRKQALKQLDGFINMMLQEPDDVRKHWVKAVCRIMFDHPDSTLLDTFDNPQSRIIVRFPLIEKALNPELVKLFATAKSPYGRWLFLLGGRGLSEVSPELYDEHGFVDPLDFLRDLLLANPDDIPTARVLIFELHRAIEVTNDRYPEEDKKRSVHFRGQMLEFLELVVRYGERDSWSTVADRYSSFLHNCV